MKPWKHPLTRDPRAKKHEKHIKEYFQRKTLVSGRTEEPSDTRHGTIIAADPYMEPIPRGSTEDNHLWNLLVRAFHPLPFMGGVGRYIRFFVRDSSSHQILGCLSLGSAVLKCAPRDSWIGWNLESRLRNLNKVANNRRFLILPHVKVPNLASRILSLLSKVGQDEWQRRYGDPLVLMETFVDSKNPGTCYKAANWFQIGMTKGFTHVVSRIRPSNGRGISTYLYTGSKKHIFVKPIVRSWRKELIS